MMYRMSEITFWHIYVQIRVWKFGNLKENGLRSLECVYLASRTPIRSKKKRQEKEEKNTNINQKTVCPASFPVEKEDGPVG